MSLLIFTKTLFKSRFIDGPIKVQASRKYSF